MIAPGYESLQEVLAQAYAQAAHGKGKERHASGEPFEAQPMMAITNMVGIGFPLGQACKKAQEAARMVAEGQPHRARAELLGAIVYLAGAVLALPMPPCAEAAPAGDNIGAAPTGVSSLTSPGRGEHPAPGTSLGGNQ
ncbi:conserved protein of unknown function [Magnetospirillum sp. XM-1]|uniref:hypothetical protein n=1 Tax=Magnetospirillum sp. XM-1 TaxID=1663591 RepID=UPI00073DD01E|nr:hypothetical protein [Magnetospirillum sp. XM-1]CUW39694.1 conserved protein of unknown function [Magnetospirillum sp. XM-1]